MNKLIIYGNIHGCYDEFIFLINQINPRKNDTEVYVGDILPKPTLSFYLFHLRYNKPPYK